MKRYSMPFGQTIGFKHEHPERTARKCASGAWDAEIVFQVWPNRASMAKTIRMQEQAAPRATHWKAVVELGPTEGY